jgi:hypothetical protein
MTSAPLLPRYLRPHTEFLQDITYTTTQIYALGRCSVDFSVYIVPYESSPTTHRPNLGIFHQKVTSSQHKQSTSLQAITRSFDNYLPSNIYGKRFGELVMYDKLLLSSQTPSCQHHHPGLRKMYSPTTTS